MKKLHDSMIKVKSLSHLFICNNNNSNIKILKWQILKELKVAKLELGQWDTGRFNKLMFFCENTQ